MSILRRGTREAGLRTAGFGFIAFDAPYLGGNSKSDNESGGQTADGTDGVQLWTRQKTDRGCLKRVRVDVKQETHGGE